MPRCSITIRAPSNLSEARQLEFLDALDKYAEFKYGTYFGYYRIPVTSTSAGFGWLGDYEFNNEYDSKQLFKHAESIVDKYV